MVNEIENVKGPKLLKSFNGHDEVWGMRKSLWSFPVRLVGLSKRFANQTSQNGPSKQTDILITTKLLKIELNSVQLWDWPDLIETVLKLFVFVEIDLIYIWLWFVRVFYVVQKWFLPQKTPEINLNLASFQQKYLRCTPKRSWNVNNVKLTFEMHL